MKKIIEWIKAGEKRKVNMKAGSGKKNKKGWLL